MASEDDYSKRFKLDKLTSDVFGVENPPKDWADVSLLAPHETLRREMQYMLKSVDKLSERIMLDSMQPWQAVYFCEWVIDVFEPFIKEHHDIEEEIYFPWLMTKANIPQKEFAKGHEELMAALDEIAALCTVIIMEKKGVDCKNEIDVMKTKMHKFVIEMKEHIMEEERDIPPLAKKEFTEEDEKEILKKVLAKTSMSELRNIFPFFLEALEDWGTPEYVSEFKQQIPGPVMYLNDTYWQPDFETCIRPKRDAPFLENEPNLTRKGCFGLSFCFRCIC